MIAGFVNIESTSGDQSNRFAGRQWQVSLLDLQKARVLDWLSSENLIARHSTIIDDHTKET